MCDGRIFSIFSGISFVISCTINSLNFPKFVGHAQFPFCRFHGERWGQDGMSVVPSS